MLNRHRQRGQAIVETSIFMPVLLTLFFACLWAGREAVSEERSFIAVRNALIFSARNDPYTELSQYAMTQSLHGTYTNGLMNEASLRCLPWNPAPALDAITRTNVSGSTLFNPVMEVPISPICTSRDMYSGLPSGKQIILMSSNVILNPTNLNATGLQYLTGKMYNLFLPTAVGETAFRSADVQTLMACLPDVEQAVTNTFDPLNDPGSAGPVAPLSSFSGSLLRVSCSLPVFSGPH